MPFHKFEMFFQDPEGHAKELNLLEAKVYDKLASLGLFDLEYVSLKALVSDFQHERFFDCSKFQVSARFPAKSSYLLPRSLSQQFLVSNIPDQTSRLRPSLQPSQQPMGTLQSHNDCPCDDDNYRHSTGSRAESEDNSSESEVYMTSSSSRGFKTRHHKANAQKQ